MFQSTRPRGRTRRFRLPKVGGSMVSIHASSREDATRIFDEIDHSKLVSIHASSREDATTLCILKLSLGSFNPRVLAGGRDCAYQCAVHPEPGFNPRVLAGGRDVPAFCFSPPHTVSIHASSREDATVSVESNINQNVTFAKARRK